MQTKKYLCVLSSLTMLLSPQLSAEDVTINQRVFTPTEGRQMGNSYGYVTSIQNIIKFTSTSCSKWLPHKQSRFSALYPLWMKRNQSDIDRLSLIYADLLRIVSKSAKKKKKDIDLLYRSMTLIALKRFKTILLRKDLTERNKFCNIFSFRLLAGYMDIKTNPQVGSFIGHYVPLSTRKLIRKK